ncbi:MAG: hypothetical protein E6H88_00705 [Chloroflexi bacterium]|nr:MAG: hypothetical protein E6H88_00705 [Chloroflexota bacterium]
MPAARSTKKTAAKKPAARKPATAGGADGRGDAAAVRAYFAQQPADKRALLEKLRGLVLKGVPDATASTSSRRPTYSSIRKRRSRAAAPAVAC